MIKGYKLGFIFEREVSRNPVTRVVAVPAIVAMLFLDAKLASLSPGGNMSAINDCHKNTAIEFGKFIALYNITKAIGLNLSGKREQVRLKYKKPRY
ncbi:hypothetical protein [Caloramator sp. Dgby_cultured_2]|uniref:hypothetical protein n=1 Tax=Caloramator sp. Dgby_cultured_2 TaxID=3029174 RepID=UPI00237E321F|nr:hypothetical protein [Caloramator sp. Dgby_cultured_2]WDU82566.1 hypothetical protein PWK10_13320 [Caloramator sp. Dgby_cultured_2]